MVRLSVLASLLLCSTAAAAPAPDRDGLPPEASRLGNGTLYFGVVRALWSPDGKFLVTTTETRLCLWGTAPDDPPRELRPVGETTRIAFSPDSRYLAVCGLASDKEILAIWDTGTGEERLRSESTAALLALRLSDDPGRQGMRAAVKALPDRNALLPEGLNPAARSRGVPEPAKLADRIPGLPADIRVAGRVFGGRLLVTSHEDGRDRLWDEGDGSLVFEADGRLHLAGDERTALVAGPGGVRLIDLATGRDRELVPATLGTHAALSLDGRRAAIWTDESRVILLWDLPGLQVIDRPATPGQLERWLQDLDNPDAAAAWRAVYRLAAVPAQAIPALAARADRMSRVEAVRWVGLLNDDRFSVRDKATHRLEELGTFAEGALVRATDGVSDPEFRARADRLLARLRSPGPTLARTGRLFAVLEAAGTPDARRLLRRLADFDADATVCRNARASLDRLER